MSREIGCPLEHDPEPWVQKGIAGAQKGWFQGGWEFKPRVQFCQQEECYTKEAEE